MGINRQPTAARSVPRVNQPARSPTFWIVPLAGALAAAALVTVVLLGFGFFAAREVSPRSAFVPETKGSTLTGHTPELAPGTPGWLPSGKGVRIPLPAVVDGRPEGLWWRLQRQPDGTSVVVTRLFLPDGTEASSPRLGAGHLFDLEGQRAQQGVGTFVVEGEKISQTTAGVTTTASFHHGRDAAGAWLEIGTDRYQPLVPADAQQLVETWARTGGNYTFRADGTFEEGQLVERKWVRAGQGTWQLDGYLLTLKPTLAPAWIATAGASGSTFLVIGSSLYSR